MLPSAAALLTAFLSILQEPTMKRSSFEAQVEIKTGWLFQAVTDLRLDDRVV